MDITGGLTAASQTLLILKQIRELDGAIDQGVLKAKILELQETTFEAKAALLDVKEAILARDGKIADLKEQLKVATSGETCPICGTGNLKTISVSPHPKLGKVGIQEK